MCVAQSYTCVRTGIFVRLHRHGVVDFCGVQPVLLLEYRPDIGIIDGFPHFASELCLAFKGKSEQAVSCNEVPKRQVNIGSAIDADHLVFPGCPTGLVAV